MKSYLQSNNKAPANCVSRLAHERTLYDARVEEHIKSGKRRPLSEGALIADEVKVAAKLHWNSKDDSLVGHSMTPEELSTLHDLYTALDTESSPQKTTYVLQTLWRDHSTECDIVGPYYTSAGM